MGPSTGKTFLFSFIYQFIYLFIFDRREKSQPWIKVSEDKTVE